MTAPDEPPAVPATPANAAPPRHPLVFVLGVARCGSTLLGRLLDRHPRVAALGEFMRLDRALARGRPCSCGERVEACPAWGPQLAWIEAEDTEIKRQLESAGGHLPVRRGRGGGSV